MRTLIISDLHLGDARYNYDHIINVLSTQDYDELIINGDFVDLWLCNFKDIRSHVVFRKIVEISKNKPTIWIRGNHDSDIVKHIGDSILSSIKIVDFLELNNRRGIIIHGHQVYWSYNSSTIDKLSALFSAWLFKLMGIDVQKFFNSTKSYSKYIDRKHGLVLDMFGNKYSIIIMGHTHLPGAKSTTKCSLFDIGSISATKTYGLFDDNCLYIKTAD
jgi:predicted phosphodiesterase